MAVFIWLLPVERRAGHRTIAIVLELSVIGEFFVLIGLVLLLRKRLAAQVDRLSEDHDVLLAQNQQLEQQNTDLATQANTVREQADELERQSAAAAALDASSRGSATCRPARLLGDRLGRPATPIGPTRYIGSLDSRSEHVLSPPTNSSPPCTPMTASEWRASPRERSRV